MRLSPAELARRRKQAYHLLSAGHQSGGGSGGDGGAGSGGGGGGGVTIIPAPFAVVNGPTGDPFGGAKFEGWSCNYLSQPTIPAPVEFTCVRQGYSATDSPNSDTTATGTVTESIWVTTTVRQPWPIGFPGSGTQSALTAALSDYIYATDTPSGVVTNNSTLQSPKPIAKWARPGRGVCGLTVRLEVVAAHRDAKAGKQISHVLFIVSDGTHTIYATVATPTILAHPGDRHAVIGYGIDLDISALNDNASFTADAVAYSRLGNSVASQRRTADGTTANQYEFSQRTYYKSTSRAANPILAYCSGAGVDAVVDADGKDNATHTLPKITTNAVDALANAFATYASAVAAFKAATNLTGGNLDGCELRISNTTLNVTVAPASLTYQSVGEFIITRDPLQLRSACVWQWGSVALSTRMSWMKFRDVSILRSGNSFMNLATAGQYVFENVDFNNNAANSQVTGNATVSTFWMGVTVTNSDNALMGAGTTPCALVRGCLGTGNNQHEAQCVIGNKFSSSGLAFSNTRGLSNLFIGFNDYPKITGTGFAAIGNTLAFSHIAFIQNHFEFTTLTANPILRLSADDYLGNVTHIVCHNNTFAGAGAAGRGNLFYDETGLPAQPSTPKLHTLLSYKGNIDVQLNNKGDVFHGTSDANMEGFTVGSPSTFIGNWAFYYGVGCQGNFANYRPNAGPSEMQAYPGRGSLIGADPVNPMVALANLWTDPKCTTLTPPSTYNNGAGDGTYTLKNHVSNTAKGIVEPVLNYTIDGVARAASNDNAGAWSAAA